MTVVDKETWKTAVCELFGGSAFAAVGPREGEGEGDWRGSAVDVMRLRTRDPRGWLSVNHAPDGDVHTLCGPDRPFLPPRSTDFDAVYDVSRRGAAQVLVTLQGDWFLTAGIPGFDEREPDLMRHAGVILDRFGPDALCYTNASAAGDDPNGDMFDREAAYEGFTDYALDCGVIVVSPTEVGVFWGFVID